MRRKIKLVLKMLAVMLISALVASLATMLYAYHIAFTNLCEAYCTKVGGKALMPRPFTCKCVNKFLVRI